MIQDGRIAEAIKASGIKNIVLLDDAFDVPTLEQADYGPLFEFLETDAGKAVVEDLGLSATALESALRQMSNEEYQEDDLKDLISRLHRKYIVTRESRYDPDGVFSSKLSNNLSDIDPLLLLLRRCSGIDVSLIGRNTPDPDWSATQIPDLIFADFYLDGEITSDQEPTAEEGALATLASIQRLEEILRPAAAAKKHPSVILMSSKDVQTEADGYRRRISDDAGKVFASRFGFIRKSDIVPIDKATDDPPQKPQTIEVRGDAANVLLDIIQSHPFGNKLFEALTIWLDSVEAGRLAMKADIEQLTLKEFAYLVTFRLAQEGLGLFDYLEWFFGECLLGAIGDAAADKFKLAQRTGLDKHAELIEGSYEKERSDKIAELYHRARIDRRPATKNEWRLGDLYLEPATGTDEVPMLWGVLTPDCDLIVRKGEMAAKRLLTVRGILIPYSAPKSSLSEFVIIKGTYYSIDWKLKDLVTRDTLEGLEFVGTLRPIYAQDLQRRALQDLSRIGLAVAPVIRMEGTFALSVVKGGKVVSVPLGLAENTRCEIYPGRGVLDASRIILGRQAAENLLTILGQLDPAEFEGEDAKCLKGAQKRSGMTTIRKALLTGAPLDTDIGSKIIVTDKMTTARGWCGIEISMIAPGPTG